MTGEVAVAKTKEGKGKIKPIQTAVAATPDFDYLVDMKRKLTG
jgi:hypothetical protein